MKNLQLSLRRKWFEMTKSREKKEDYRELNIYWFKRLVWNYRDVLLYNGIGRYGFISDEDVYSFVTSQRTRSQFGFNPFILNIMTLGYPKSSDAEKFLRLEHNGIEIGYGKPEWGAEPNKLYFIIKHGNIINEPINEVDNEKE